MNFMDAFGSIAGKVNEMVGGEAENAEGVENNEAEDTPGIMSAIGNLTDKLGVSDMVDATVEKVEGAVGLDINGDDEIPSE